jgi:hypothetical protein
MLAKLKAWYAQPYNPNMNATGWILMVGLFMVGSLLWAMVLGHIRGGIEAVVD